jgi:hypothetical protein
MIARAADKRAEILFPTGEGSGQYPREHPDGATKITAVQANAYEGPTWI